MINKLLILVVLFGIGCGTTDKEIDGCVNLCSMHGGIFRLNCTFGYEYICKNYVYHSTSERFSKLP